MIGIGPQVHGNAVDREKILTSAIAAVTVEAAFIELEDPEAEAALRAHWPHEREWTGPDESGNSGLPDSTRFCRQLEAIDESYGINNIPELDPDALLAAAFVVQKDLVRIAKYAARLERENHHLRRRLYGLA